MNTRYCHPRLALNVSLQASRQRGMSLLISLILLVLLTVIGVAAMQGTQMQERMAGNLRDRTMAFEAAEAALREGEFWLQGRVALPNTAAIERQKAPIRNAAVWDGQDPPPAGNSPPIVIPGVGSLSRLPVSHVGYQGAVCVEAADLGDPASCLDVFNVTALGFGGSDNAMVILQSRFVTVGG